MASLLRIIAVGESVAEDIALQWAVENGVSSAGSTVLRERFRKPPFFRSLERLRQNTIDSDAMFLLTLSFGLGPEQKKVIEFLSAQHKPFLHLWSSVPLPGRLARHFLEMHKIKTLNVVGSTTESGDAIQTFVWSVFESIPIPATLSSQVPRK
jgi:hypothetical protein